MVYPLVRKKEKHKRTTKKKKKKRVRVRKLVSSAALRTSGPPTIIPTIIKLRPASPSPLPLPPFSLPSSFLFRLFLFSLHFSAHPFQERKIRISPLSSPFLPPLLFSFPFLFSLFTKNVSAEAVQAPSLLFSDADEWDQLSWAGADQGCPSGWSPKHSWSFVAPPWCIPWCMV